MRTREEIQKEIQKEIERDIKERSNIVAEFVKATEKITDLRYTLDYLVSDEARLNNRIDNNKEKLKLLEE